MLDSTILRSVRKAFPLLDRLESGSLDEFIGGAAEVHIPEGEVMFRPGDGCDGFGFVVEGGVKVGLTSEAGRELVLYRVKRGQSCTVTVSCLISNTPYSALGVVEEPLTAVVIPRDLFSQLIERSAVFRAFVFEIFSMRVNHLMELVYEVAFNKLDQRLSSRLLDLGPLIAMSHQELAAELGTSREIISRILESLADDGAVTLGRRKILVERPELLKTRCG